MSVRAGNVRRYVLGDGDRLVATAARAELEQSFRAAQRLLRQMRSLAAAQRSVLSELAGAEAVRYRQKLPQDEAHDPKRGYRYYYHCHDDARGRRGVEHGHFHLFADAGTRGEVTHLVAIAVDAYGMPQRLFTTNPWVTSERWRGARKVMSLLDAFSMRCPRALWRVNAWLGSMLGMFRPQLRWLLRARDARLRAGGAGLLGNRRVPVLSQCKVSISAQAGALDAALAGG